MTQDPKSPSIPRTQQADGSGPSGSGSQSDLAQAYRDLARGEQAAAALEANLSKIEGTLDALLARFDSMEQAQEDKASSKGKVDRADDRKKSPGVAKETPTKDT